MTRGGPRMNVIGRHPHSGEKRIAAMTLAVTLSYVAEDRYQRLTALLQQFTRHSEGYR